MMLMVSPWSSSILLGYEGSSLVKVMVTGHSGGSPQNTEAIAFVFKCRWECPGTLPSKLLQLPVASAKLSHLCSTTYDRDEYLQALCESPGSCPDTGFHT